ncbi:MAG: TMEM143 family protein [Pseudomonadales bacterium]|jgi:hypothetical protein|nr:TMEM143 family protein [Pseudomonadales bacterium]
MGSKEAKGGERFIPLRRQDVLELCRAKLVAAGGDAEHFGHAARLLAALFHHDFHADLEALKDLYAPLNPDLDARLLTAPAPGEATARRAELTSALERVLERANFERITDDGLRAALDEESLFRIRLHVDFDDFEQVLFYRRGETPRREIVPRLFGLLRREIEFTSYDRVVVFVAFRDADWFAARDRRELPFQPGATLLKMFRNVPRADLEMLFPNTEVRMKLADKLMIGVPAAASGVALLVTKLGPTLLLVGSLVAFWLGLHDREVVLDQAALLALAAALGTLGGFLFKQFSSFKNRKIRFMKTLADSLYFRNLDNNAGVFHRLVDAAEEEECKEALLAWTFLLTAEAPHSAQTLDAAIEAFLAEQVEGLVDFEIDDALAKLVRLGLVSERPDGALSALPPAAAARRLDEIWDGLYRFA